MEQKIRDCKYGINCYQQNVDHRNKFRHPPGHHPSHNNTDRENESNKASASLSKVDNGSVVISSASADPSYIDLANGLPVNPDARVERPINLITSDSDHSPDRGDVPGTSSGAFRQNTADLGEEVFPTFIDVVMDGSQDSDSSSVSGRTSSTVNYSLSPGRDPSPSSMDIDEQLPDLQDNSLDPGARRFSSGASGGETSKAESSGGVKRKATDKAKEDKKKKKAEEKAEKERLKAVQKAKAREDKEAEKASKQKKKAKEQLEKEKQRMESRDNAEMNLYTEIDSRISEEIVDNSLKRLNAVTTFHAQVKGVFELANLPENVRHLQNREIPGMITWSRKKLDDDGVHYFEEATSEVMVVMVLKEFLAHVKREDDTLGTLSEYAAALLNEECIRKRGTTARDLTLAIVGMEHHIKNNYPGKGQHLPFREKKHRCLVELQLECGAQFRELDKIEDLADLVKGFHRAIATKPAKERELQKDNYQLTGAVEKGMKIDSTNTKAAAKDWWTKMLMQIPGVARQKAEAIADAYDSPTALFRRYKELPTEADKLELLAEIKGKGHSRKIGSQMSGMIYRIMTDTNGSQLVNGKNNG